jgi:hypothetical protein
VLTALPGHGGPGWRMLGLDVLTPYARAQALLFAAEIS